MFEDISQISAGVAAHRGKTRELKIRPFWKPRICGQPPSTLSPGARYDPPGNLLMLRAVKRELDVGRSPLPASYTSGGLDSSLLSPPRPAPPRANAIHTYAGPVHGKVGTTRARTRSRRVTHAIASVHHVVTADDESLGRALDVVSRSLAEPLGDPAVLPTSCWLKRLAKTVKVHLVRRRRRRAVRGYRLPGHKICGRWQRLPRRLRRAAGWAVDRWPSRRQE